MSSPPATVDLQDLPLRGRPSRRWPLAALTLLTAGVIVASVLELGPPSGGSARASTQLVAATQGVVQSTVTGTGEVEPTIDDDVNFPASGALTSLDVKLGQHVRKGQLLATLDHTQAQITLDQADLNLSGAESALTSAEDETVTSTRTAAQIAATVTSDRLAVEQDTVADTSDRQAYDQTWLYAPASGTVASLTSLSLGETVSAGSTSNVASSDSSSGDSTNGTTSTGSGSSTSGSTSPIVEIVDTRALTMTVPLSESDIAQVKVGQPATISLDALPSVELAARVSSVSPTATTSDSVVSYEVTLTAEQTNSQVKPGMDASASIVVGQAQGVTVPVDALSGTGSLATVDLRENGRTVPTDVAVGLRGTDYAEIASGLKAGDQLVVTTTLPSVTTSASSPGSSSSSSSGTLDGGGTLGGAASALGAAAAPAGGGPPGGGGPA
ncbi:MAG TPA: HlyD family efflux transporter periplasmic adaptor subunit [Solirubrobacteraceae bacterium]|jgi:macrolide-specific efflux system membrane fusion protein|nr:HlyD family efflux transporter periplasmic adaptor subunit [Solirubrobacteraceae bacterium]